MKAKDSLNTKMNKPKLLLFDIENSKNKVEGDFFELWEQNIPYDNIKIERHLFCISYKWYGESKIHTLSIRDDKRFKKNIHDDYYVASEFAKIIEQADAIVGHNSDKFDMKMLNSRLIYHGLKPLPKVIQLDTYKMAKRYFRFNSNRLDYLCKYLGYKGKTKNPPNLWDDCFNGNVKALKQMEKYNRNDVDLLEFVFNKLKPFIKNNPLNTNLFKDGVNCPSCSSQHLQSRGFNYTRTGKYRRFQCLDCYAWSDERTAINNKVELK